MAASLAPVARPVNSIGSGTPHDGRRGRRDHRIGRRADTIGTEPLSQAALYQERGGIMSVERRKIRILPRQRYGKDQAWAAPEGRPISAIPTASTMGPIAAGTSADRSAGERASASGAAVSSAPHRTVAADLRPAVIVRSAGQVWTRPQIRPHRPTPMASRAEPAAAGTLSGRSIRSLVCSCADASGAAAKSAPHHRRELRGRRPGME